MTVRFDITFAPEKLSAIAIAIADACRAIEGAESVAVAVNGKPSP